MSTPDENRGLVDWAFALDTAAGDEDLLNVLIDTFLEETPMLMDQLRKAIDEENFAETERYAHTIKGSLRIFDAKAGVAAAYVLEMMGKDQKLVEPDAAYAKLQDLLAQVDVEFQARKGG